MLLICNRAYSNPKTIESEKNTKLLSFLPVHNLNFSGGGVTTLATAAPRIARVLMFIAVLSV